MTTPARGQLGEVADEMIVTIERGRRRCTVTGADLSLIEGGQTIRIRLLAVLVARTSGSSSASATSQEEASTGRHPPISGTELASYLADRLNDTKNLSFYKLVAERVPPDVIRNALIAALAVPAGDTNRSRANRFSHLIGPHVARSKAADGT
jgi:hypothetical protein